MYSHRFNAQQAKQIGDQIGVDWEFVDLTEFRRGLSIETDADPNGDPVVIGCVALANLLRTPDYYSRLMRMKAATAAILHGHAVGDATYLPA